MYIFHLALLVRNLWKESETIKHLLWSAELLTLWGKEHKTERQVLIWGGAGGMVVVVGDRNRRAEGSKVFLVLFIFSLGLLIKSSKAAWQWPQFCSYDQGNAGGKLKLAFSQWSVNNPQSLNDVRGASKGRRWVREKEAQRLLEQPLARHW